MKYNQYTPGDGNIKWVTETGHDEFGRVVWQTCRVADENLLPCPACNAKGNITLLTSVTPCPECQSAGKVVPGRVYWECKPGEPALEQSPSSGTNSPAPMEGANRPYYWLGGAGVPCCKVYMVWYGWVWRWPESNEDGR